MEAIEEGEGLVEDLGADLQGGLVSYYSRKNAVPGVAIGAKCE
jgi:hypothetical protein